MSINDTLKAALDAAKTTPTRKVEDVKILSVAEFFALQKEDKLRDHFAKNYVMAEHKTLEIGKAITVFELTRPAPAEGKKAESISAWMVKTFGVKDDNAFKPAKVFRELVAFNHQTGAADDTAGHAQITEAEFNLVRGQGASRLMIDVCKMLGYIDKREASPEQKAALREELCQLLRNFGLYGYEATLPGGGNVKDLAKTAETALRPEKSAKDKAEKDKPEAEKPLEATPLAVLDIIAAEGGKFFKALMEAATANPAEAVVIAEKLGRVATNAEKVRSAIVAAIQPAEAPATEAPATETAEAPQEVAA